MALTVATAIDPRALEPALRSQLKRLDPGLRVYDMATLEEIASTSLWQVRWQATIAGLTAIAAMILAAVGLFGVIAFSVARRTREIGVRMALGADRARISRMLVVRGLRLVAIGIGLGLILGAALTRFLTAYLFGINPLDPVAFAAGAALWISVAALASLIPARRAAAVEPSVALRYD